MYEKFQNSCVITILVYISSHQNDDDTAILYILRVLLILKVWTIFNLQKNNNRVYTNKVRAGCAIIKKTSCSFTRALIVQEYAQLNLM